ncbi:MAG: hypothetical protein KU29_03990 [Sulfurovum sp. FS06-10]|nr:MAG: hypothetical protein KU29_03990 [Sulfurovum sp. FS06-10]
MPLKAIEINENLIHAYQALVKVYTTLNNHQYALFYQTKLDKVIERMKGKTLPTEQEILFGR